MWKAYNFNKAKQETGETVPIFANKLRRLEMKCTFDISWDCTLRNLNSLKKCCKIRKLDTVIAEAADKKVVVLEVMKQQIT